MNILSRLAGNLEKNDKKREPEADRIHRQMNEITRYLETLKQQQKLVNDNIQNYTKMLDELRSELINTTR